MSVFTKLYESAKRSRDNARSSGLVFETALLTQHMRDIIDEFELDFPIEDLELTSFEMDTWTAWEASQDHEPEEPPEDYTAWNKVMECLEKLYQEHMQHPAPAEYYGVKLAELMTAYNEWLD